MDELLQENGDFLLQENNDNILLESSSLFNVPVLQNQYRIRRVE